MSEYGPPPDPNQPWDPYAYGPPDPSSPPVQRTGEQLGARLSRRPEPRFTSAVAGAGAALVLLGLVIWTGDFLFSADSPDTDRNVLGGILLLLVVGAGYTLTITRRTGSLATAGVVLGAVGVPGALAFLTFDATSPDNGLPFSFEAVIWVSIVVWTVSYLFVPGARGRTLFVFLVASGFYDFVLTESSRSNVTLRVSQTFDGDDTSSGFGDTGTLAALGLAFGLGYFAIAWVLDAHGRHGPATGLVFPAFSATVTGLVAAAPDLHRAGVGVLVLLVGALMCWYGGRFGRRFTCFAAALGVAVGVVLVVDRATSDATGGGIAVLLVGAALIAAAHVLSVRLGEPDDMDQAVAVRSR